MMLRESMLDSVIRARDKWMKPEGSMFPSHATLFFGAISNEDDRKAKQREYTHSLEEVRRFSGEMKQYYNLDTSTLEPVLEREMEEYYIYSALWTELKPESVVGTPKTILKLDLNTCTLADVQGVPTTPFSFQIPAPAQAPLNVSGFAGWFTTDFWGSTATPVVNRVTLSTGPEMGYTHWGQHVFYFKAPVVIRSETTANNSKTSQYRTNIHGTVEMVRQPKNQRLYRLNVSTRVNDVKAINQVYDIP
jgi:protein arginine N-methyltransferase 1